MLESLFRKGSPNEVQLPACHTKPMQSPPRAPLLRLKLPGVHVDACTQRHRRDDRSIADSAPAYSRLPLPRSRGLPDAQNGVPVQGRPGKKRRPRGETPLLGVQLNAQIALGAKIALLRVRTGQLVSIPIVWARVCIEYVVFCSQKRVGAFSVAEPPGTNKSRVCGPRKTRSRKYNASSNSQRQP